MTVRRDARRARGRVESRGLRKSVIETGAKASSQERRKERDTGEGRE
jgi:hypothetical protein